MRDWADIDRTLEELGPAPQDVAALITRALGPDRSRDALEAGLEALGAEPAPALAARSTPAPVSSATSARPLTSYDTNEQWPPESAPPGPLAADLDSATEQLLGGADEPVRAPSSVPAPAYTFSDLPPVAGPERDEEPELSLGAPSEAPAAAEEAARVSTRALLERELDPSEFPSRPPQRVQTPPPPAAESAAEEDDFEMLIEDEEILEIQEDDVVTDEGDEP